MKIMVLLLSILLLSCTAPKTEMPTGILSETEFSNMLKEIHLEDVAFELNKSNGIINAKNSYQSIYKEYDVDDSTFSKSLDYYTKNPEKLEKIYTDVLEQLTDECSTLNPKETN